jgi:hypothetical protein
MEEACFSMVVTADYAEQIAVELVDELVDLGMKILNDHALE